MRDWCLHTFSLLSKYDIIVDFLLEIHLDAAIPSEDTCSSDLAFSCCHYW